ncbi:MAG TPA: TRAP transporter small permease [Paracoccaceae bacterium]|nr:TRAP transporter small permease [Paracoccaceae bacterium]
MRATSSSPGEADPGRLARAARGLGRAHDALTEAGMRLAMAGLAGIVAAYVYEVVARYAFDAPTRWSADLVSYLLLFVTFMAMPEVTRRGGHVAVTVMVERLPPRVRGAIARAVAAAGALICLGLAELSADETSRQFQREVRMMAAWPVQKGWISIWIAYGFAGSALHFARLAVSPEREEG